MKSIIIAALITLVLFEAYLIECNHDNDFSVVTENGGVIGRTQVWNDKQVNVFLGIPYAEPPIGSLRFKKPVAVKDWCEPLRATKWPNPCYQTPITDTFLSSNFSEDCLYLNIWQPGNSNNQPKAVMFWIHGGGLESGSSSEYQFQGQILASKGDVVVVTVNYRLGSLGFFYTGTDDAPGNVGLWDQIMALKWIRNNIKYFGGDKDRITIFGHSGGSWAVSIHILSPITIPLYKQAILMSCGEISNQVASASLAKQIWLTGAKQIGCAYSSDDSFNPEIIRCLQNINASSLTTIIFLPEVNGNVLDLMRLITIDGTLLPDTPKVLLETGNYKQNLNLLVGRVEDEASPILTTDPRWTVASPANLSYYESRKAIIELSHRINFFRPVVDGKPIADIYFNPITPHTTDYALLSRTIGIGLGDAMIGCPTTILAEKIFKYDQSANVYQYYYTSKFGAKHANQSVYFCGQWMGTCHGSDLTPLFGLPYIYPDAYYNSQRDEALEVIDFYTHFVKYGYPSKQNGKEWPKYYCLNNNIIKPSQIINNTVHTYHSEFVYGLKTTECEYLWEPYIYTIAP